MRTSHSPRRIVLSLPRLCLGSETCEARAHWPIEDSRRGPRENEKREAIGLTFRNFLATVFSPFCKSTPPSLLFPSHSSRPLPTPSSIPLRILSSITVTAKPNESISSSSLLAVKSSSRSVSRFFAGPFLQRREAESERAGDITYSFAMGAVSVVLVAFSVQELARGDQHDKTLHIPAAVVVGIAFRELYCFVACSLVVPGVNLLARNSHEARSLLVLLAVAQAQLADWCPLGRSVRPCHHRDLRSFAGPDLVSHLKQPQRSLRQRFRSLHRLCWSQDCLVHRSHGSSDHFLCVSSDTLSGSTCSPLPYAL